MHIPQPPAPTTPPSLQIRQLDFHILTQTLIRPSTTIITTITLGTIEPASTETIAAVPLPETTSHHHSGLSGGQIGAILGSVVGIVVLLLIIGFCYVGRRRMPITYDDEKESRYKYRKQTHNNNGWGNSQKKKAKGKSSRTTRSVYEYDYTEEEAAYYAAAPAKSKRKSSSSSKKNNGATVQEPAPAVVAERIPGGPRYPTYRAIPISNPRNPQIWRTG
ncbi:hypothetical protein BBK36DRAFT_1141025 [Trichoderma citrinoviride]|uniref:Mid2 domain-containing protein n=1 Tax=Trichoderma citrinoviride TaxID=58853 RepID=A0A2T4B9Z7_9HYPO|nr:hypothetical protein BBK36DRAFT_1141025 [Trichoderma citrinoviride]PTB66155.1 hypothetical protein BBK36DRAFT_1141025 [Trichoderma citrinoviride]